MPTKYTNELKLVVESAEVFASDIQWLPPDSRAYPIEQLLILLDDESEESRQELLKVRNVIDLLLAAE